MARQDVVNFCMWCSESPCACDKPKKTTAKPRTTPKAKTEVYRAQPVTRPAIPAGQGIAPSYVEQSATIDPRPVHSVAAPSVLAPPWHDDVPDPTFAQTLEADSDREIAAAKKALIDGGLVRLGSGICKEWKEGILY